MANRRPVPVFDTENYYHDWRLAFVETAGSNVQLQTVSAHMSVDDNNLCTLTATLTNARSNDAGTAMLIPAFVLLPFDLVRNYQRQARKLMEAGITTLLVDHVFKNMPRPANYTKNSVPDELVTLLHSHSYHIPVTVPHTTAEGTVLTQTSIHPGLKSGERGSGLTPADVTFRYHIRSGIVHLSMIKVSGVAIISLSRIPSIVFGPPTAAAFMPTPFTAAKALTDDEYLDSIKPFPAAAPAPTVRKKRLVQRGAGHRGAIPMAEEREEGEIDATVTDISRVNMSEDDIIEVQRTFHFTDNVLHQLLLRAIEAVPASELDDVFVFSSLLMAQLDKTVVPPRCRGADERISYIFHDRVVDYATVPAAAGTVGKRVSCLLSKKYIFIPVNANTHWALYMFYRPFEPTAPEPLAYVFDSMYSIPRLENNPIPFNVHHMMLTYAGLYLKNVAAHYIQQPGSADLINFERMNRIVRVPQQPFRSNACGMYVCEFVRHLLSSKSYRERFVADLTADTTMDVFVDEFEGFNEMNMHQIKQGVLEMLEVDLTVANKRRKRG